MTSRDNIACHWFERVWNGNDVAAIAELAAPDMKAHGADGVTRTPETFSSTSAVSSAMRCWTSCSDGRERRRLTADPAHDRPRGLGSRRPARDAHGSGGRRRLRGGRA